MATGLVGYIVLTRGGDIGTRGSVYTYIMAGNGLWLEAENPLLEARIQLSSLMVRGLHPLLPRLELRHGRIPAHLLSLAMDAFSARSELEGYAAIAWDGEKYELVWPAQERTATSVVYDKVPNTVVGLHSHGRMGAFFSATDDGDDLGFLLEVVVGKLDRLVPAAGVRLCIYGYHAPVELREVLAGLAPWIEEAKAPGGDWRF